MATLALSALRQRVAAAVEALASPAAWRESRWAYDTFPVADPSTYAHLAFAVGTPATDFDSPMESVRHKRGSAGGLVETEAGIRWLYRLRADAQVSDYDAALDAEATLLAGVTGAALTDVHISVLSMRRGVVGDGLWLISDMRLRCDHRIAIQ